MNFERRQRIPIANELLFPGQSKTGDYIREGFYVELAALMSKFEENDPRIISLREERKELLTKMKEEEFSSPFDLSQKMKLKDQATYRQLEKVLLRKLKI
jgi:hypothetical protein